jgi:hypothetical protein
LDRALALWEHLAKTGTRVILIGFSGAVRTTPQGVSIIEAGVDHPLALPLRQLPLTHEASRSYGVALSKVAREGGYEIVAVNLSPLISRDQASGLLLAETLVELAGDQVQVTCIAPWTSQTAVSRLSINEKLRELGYLRWAGESGPWWRRVDWHHTRAYSLERGDIRLNLVGREPFGVVVPGPEAQECVKALLREFVQWQPAPASGLFCGPYAHWGPDVILEARDVAFGPADVETKMALLPDGFISASTAALSNYGRWLSWENSADLLSRLLAGVPFESRASDSISAKDQTDVALRLYLEDLERRYDDLRAQYFSTVQWAQSLERELQRKNALLKEIESSWLHRLATWVRVSLGMRCWVL